MGFLFALGRLLTSRYTGVLVLAGLGVAAGLLIFVFVFPGKPKIGVINVPYTVIGDASGYFIGEHLNYARNDDSIKAVVIRLASPGGELLPASACTTRPERCEKKSPWCW